LPLLKFQPLYVGIMWTKMAQNMVYWQEVVNVCGKKNQGFTVVLNR